MTQPTGIPADHQAADRRRPSAWMTNSLLILLVVGVVVAVFGVVFFAVTNTSPAAGRALPGVTSIAEVRFCHPASISDEVPLDCAWHDVHLPKLFAAPLTHAGQSVYDLDDGWFEASFQNTSDQPRELGLYIELDRSGRVWINGKDLQTVGNLSGRLPTNWNRGQLLIVPSSLLTQGSNTIRIQVRSYRYRATLGAIKVGPPDVLRDYRRRLNFYRAELVEILGVTAATVGVFMLAVWLSRRTEKAYLWFGLTCLTWSVITVDFYAEYPPLPADLWDHIVICCHVLAAVFICTFILRYSGRRWPRVEMAMWMYFGAGATVFFAKGLAYSTVYLWLAGTWLWSTYFVYLLAREGWRRSWWEGCLITLAAVTEHTAAAYDLWLFTNVDFGDKVFVGHYFEPLHLLVVGLTLIRAFIDSLNSYQRLTHRLEEIVESKTRELAAQYKRTTALEREKVLTEERGRIMSEMHDGIGSQLTIALSLARTSLPDKGKGELATVLMESMQDLQLIINSLEPMEQDLLTVLGTLRYQMEDRLRTAGVSLKWKVVDLPPLPSLTPQSVLAILRICQEAFANVLKHSGATDIEVTTGIDAADHHEERAFVSIMDNGRGIGTKRIGGRGLQNMRRRASALGGELSIESRRGQTLVLLRFPTGRDGETAIPPASMPS